MRHIFGIVVAIGFLSPTAYAQPTAAVQKSCTIAPEQQSPASLALANGSAAEAERLYAPMPPSSGRTVGIVRAQISKARPTRLWPWPRAKPQPTPGDAALMHALGKAQLRAGSVAEAERSFLRVLSVERCIAYAHLDLPRAARR